MMTGLYPAAAAFLGLAGLAAIRLKAQGSLIFAAAGEDEDIKIAGSFTREPDISEADAAARAYLKQKSAGNVDRARGLGQAFAGLLREWSEELLSSDPQGLERLRAHHKILMLSYVVNKTISGLSPNSIVAQTALNVFYDTIEEETPELNPHVRDMAGFSLYILCERSEGRMEDEAGGIFAQLCGKEADRELIEEGNALYRDYYKACKSLHEMTEYLAV
ncbi:MAG: hypothetical protein LBU86_00540 [Oscillospiraceae bacterium]|jgi:hypothetical protein|nr:hypothetical protein [Oscillospiraceae bacterium]